MKKEELVQIIKERKSFLCVGLDTDVQKLPTVLKGSEDAIFDFNKSIIDATADLCVAYKPNLAFYESEGMAGWDALRRTVEYLRENYNHFLIADAKRGDIGNTSKMYARAFFENMNFDTVTVAPYMGEDSVKPFLDYAGKWVTLLALTSNKGAFDFQYRESDGVKLFETVIEKSKEWGGTAENMMYVVGATKADQLSEIRKHIPNNFLLVPGIGAQGGSLEDVCRYGMTKECGLLINSSRGIIYADGSDRFAEGARAAAKELQEKMERILTEAGIC